MQVLKHTYKPNTYLIMHFELYINPKETDKQLSITETDKQYVDFHFAKDNSDEVETLYNDNDNTYKTCPLCQYDNEENRYAYDDTYQNGWCKNCAFWLSNSCPKCKTTLRFSHNVDDVIDDKCWICDESLFCPA